MEQANPVFYLSLTLGLPGVTRKADKSKIDTQDADPAMIGVSKEILDSDIYRRIKSLDGEVRRWVGANSLPAVGLKRGVYAVPVGLLENVETALERFRAQRMDLVAQFLADYPARVEDARERLGGQFQQRDYPDRERMQSAFTWGIRYLSFGVPEGLEGVNKVVYERERQKAEAAWQETLDEWRKVLRVSFADLVDHCADKLSGGRMENGVVKPKIFRDSMVANIKEFLATFEARNVVNDGELADLVAKAKALTDGVDAEVLRDDARTRAMVGEGFREIKTKLDTMIVDRPVRKITFEEDANA